MDRITDPRKLVPGDPASLRAVARRWHQFGDALTSTSTGLGGLDTGPWAGTAQQAFTSYIQRTKPLWHNGSDACHAAGDAVARYADVVEWAHREVRLVVESWQRAAGPEQRAQAVGDLDRVRKQVTTAGDDSAVVVRSANAEAPQLRTMADDPDPNRWDTAPHGHPDPKDINASESRAHILWGDHHTPDQESGGHHPDSGIPGKTVFPADWDSDKIIDSVEDVGRNPDSDPVQQPNGNWKVDGTRDGVDMTVIVADDGTIITAYPTGGEGVARNDEDGEPQLLNPPDEPGDEVESNPAEEENEAAEVESGAEESDQDAEAHEDRADAAADAGDEDTASSEYAAAEESRAEAETARELAEQQRRRTDQLHDTDQDQPDSIWQEWRR